MTTYGFRYRLRAIAKEERWRPLKEVGKVALVVLCFLVLCALWAVVG